MENTLKLIITRRVDNETREFTLRVRLTNEEHMMLQAAADEAGQSLSEYVRRKIFKSV